MSATCGTANGYIAGCRCEPCRLAKRETQRAYQARRKAGLTHTPTTFDHGTLTKYRHGCTCDECRQAAADHRRKYARRRKEATTPAAEPVAKPTPRFENDLVNLTHAMTLEDWQAREAADPACRPVTQAKMQLRAERMSTTGDGLTPFERIIAEGTL